ncbi:MAG: DNA primase [Azospira oryzae]|nr:MAG: DNA primase [Azospira oryzae]
MINRDTIEEVKNRIDIVDVISDFITLKKSGQNYKALSPFSSEKTPSFYVVPNKGIFKDFSSGKGGDAFTFVMEHEKMTYVEAIRYLAKKYGVEIQEEKVSDEFQAQQSERESLYILMNFAKEFYKDKLIHSEEGQSIGLSYFRERGFTDRTIQKFELGYALDGWEHFSKEAIQKGYNKDLLEKTGLVVKRDDGSSYDRFRGRVIFPVHSLPGKVIAFGARMLGKDKNQPKYINSPETDIYHKSNVLYGLYQAKNAIRQFDNCYLVEGYTDVISMHQADVENVVASSGTALTEEQIKLIRRFTENVTVLFDGDAAGIKAALRGIDMILHGGLNVRVLLFPDNEDPDSFSRKVGTTEFQKYLKENTKDFVSFKADLFAKEAAGDPIKKAASIKEIVTSISLIPDPVKRSVYIQETSQLLKIAEPVLLTELNKILIQERKKQDKDKSTRAQEEMPMESGPVAEVEAPVRIDAQARVQFQEKECIRLLLNYSDVKLEDEALSVFLLNELNDVQFVDANYKKIFDDFLQAAENNQHIDSKFFIENGTTEIRQIVASLITVKREVSPHWADKHKIFISKDADELDKKALSNVRYFKYRLVQLWVEENKEKLKLTSDELEIDDLLDKQIALKSAEAALAEELGIVVGKY